ncbi:MAG TPA: HIT domain-containing protein [Geobacteraceae bacterium]|nr:HIT domain-containing protein [Geobacteraceae bacterium]
MHNQSVCPFCNTDKSTIIMANDQALAIYDGFPVTPGHSLIVPLLYSSRQPEKSRQRCSTCWRKCASFC